MADLSQYTDAQLQAMLAPPQASATPSGPDLSKYSDEDLQKMLGQQTQLPNAGFWDFPKTGQEALRRTSAAAGALGEGIASIPDLPATFSSIPNALLNPKTPGAPFVQNLASETQSSPIAPLLGQRIKEWLEGQTGGALNPQTQQEQVGQAAMQGAGAGALLGPLAALSGASGTGTTQYAQNQGVSPDKAALLGLLAGGAPSVIKGGISSLSNSDALDQLVKGDYTPPESPSGGPLNTAQQLTQAGVPLEGKNPAQNLQVIKDWMQGQRTNAIQGVSPQTFDPEAFNRDLTKGYYNAKQNVSDLADQAKALGQGKFIDVGDLNDKLDSLLQSQTSNQFLTPTHAGALQKIAAIKGKLDTSSALSDAFNPDVGPQLGLNDLVDLKRSVNDMFSPNNRSNEIGQLSDAVQSKLAAAKTDNPEFGEALDKFNHDHAVLRQNLEDNKVMSPIWNLEDAWGTKGNDALGISQLPPETLNRANNTLQNIKTPQQLQLIEQYASPEQASSLKAAKLQDILSKTSANNSSLSENSPLVEHITQGTPAYDQLTKLRQVQAILNAKGLNEESELEPQRSLFNRVIGAANAARHGATTVMSPWTADITGPRMIKGLGDAFGSPGPNYEAMQQITKQTAKNTNP